MDMPENQEKAARFIKERAAWWQHQMGLDHFTIEHVFLDEFYQNDSDGDNPQLPTTAITEAKWQYRYAKIFWYMKSAVGASPEALEKVLVHELVHVALAPEQEIALAKHDKEVELSTENITIALWNLYKDRND